MEMTPSFMIMGKIKINNSGMTLPQGVTINTKKKNNRIDENRWLRIVAKILL